METAYLEDDKFKRYDILTNVAEKKILSQARSLNIDEFSYEGRYKYSIIYYDTPENLLTNTGILLYKTWEKGKYYFVIQRRSILPSTSKLKRNEIYRHQIKHSDTPYMHSFYLINGITSMFSTQFSIDLEYVIKNVRPKIIVNIKTTVYKAFNGTGFKSNLYFEDVVYNNTATKQQRKNKELTIELLAPKSFLPAYKNFIRLLEKYCKDIFAKNETHYEYANRITQPPTKKDDKK
ncbi:MAG: hypothetical protein PHH71_02965 [Clostridia bacterium]|jgi:hypothetical protein|nr:hypothetical protein [Clostridia bacterium]MDD3231786.1 hypothetical protein [Clostridia bacterium]MDD3862310.1 hypothetical protein [Clostridia bacterium]MDD4408412.1 hypothetical protein [Clostridia bacterium]